MPTLMTFTPGATLQTPLQPRGSSSTGGGVRTISTLRATTMVLVSLQDGGRARGTLTAITMISSHFVMRR
jgi:hypothetical protein